MAEGKNGKSPSWTYCFKSCRRWVSPGSSAGPSALGWVLVGTILFLPSAILRSGPARLFFLGRCPFFLRINKGHFLSERFPIPRSSYNLGDINKYLAEKLLLAMAAKLATVLIRS